MRALYYLSDLSYLIVPISPAPTPENFATNQLFSPLRLDVLSHTIRNYNKALALSTTVWRLGTSFLAHDGHLREP